jgi:ribosomal protein S18 acetylase RimI-like enzyme
MDASLRTPTPADYWEITSWIVDAKSCLQWAGPRLEFPFAVGELPQLLTMTGGESYCLGPRDASPYGFGQHWPRGPNRVHLGRIIVSPALREKGLGSLLVKQLSARAVAVSGANEVTLNVYRDNPGALSLYRKLGFVPVETESRADAIFMRLDAADVWSDPGLPTEQRVE